MIKKVSIIGTGVIGTGWIIRCLAHNKKVIAFDKNIKSKKKLINEIKRAWPFVKKLFNKNEHNYKNFLLCLEKIYLFFFQALLRLLDTNIQD